MKSKSRKPIEDKPRRFPVMHCAALEELAGHLGAHERRVLARRFERWAAQLTMSAHLIEAVNPESSAPAYLDEVVCATGEWPELAGKSVAECLAEAARLEEHCHKIRLGLSVAGYIGPDREQIERRQFIFPN
jgi:hypothetical protein